MARLPDFDKINQYLFYKGLTVAGFLSWVRINTGYGITKLTLAPVGIREELRQKAWHYASITEPSHYVISRAALKKIIIMHDYSHYEFARDLGLDERYFSYNLERIPAQTYFKIKDAFMQEFGVDISQPFQRDMGKGNTSFKRNMEKLQAWVDECSR